MITVPEAARRTGRNPETIRRWIRDGKLTSWKVGTQYLIEEDALADAMRGALAGRQAIGSVGPEHRLSEVAVPYLAGSPETTTVPPPVADVWLPQIVGRIVRAVDPVRIILFGSRARGDSRPDSDYDLLVVLERADDRRALRLQVRSAIDDLPVSKDVLVATADQLDDRHGRTWGALHWALQDGVVVYARA